VNEGRGRRKRMKGGNRKRTVGVDISDGMKNENEKRERRNHDRE
jgi:hypothetical protein